MPQNKFEKLIFIPVYSSPVSVARFSWKKEDKSMATFSVTRNYFCCFQVRDFFTLHFNIQLYLTYTMISLKDTVVMA